MGKKSIDTKLIKDVLKKFEESEATSLKLELNSKKLKIKKAIPIQPVISDLYENQIIEQNKNIIEKSDDKDKNVFIEADRVGKYFSIHPPDSPDRLKEGDTIAHGERMGHIVSMEVVYDVFAPFDLVVKNIYINDSDPVEYGQALYEVEAI
ncbi:MAG: hypothetical protein C0601_12110 [Candidatus Muiribacterium halophilum]|uniref:Lipoyl-binding domain-containing protein n=1 Tax=Muiribacterium halophilum TaxID=2053465 RepID=A0A2N5ZAM3_MUIH1|nr:MAG: hypothetical protein C0601_12110 [Candidatus Muirbacterium halophilum]